MRRALVLLLALLASTGAAACSKAFDAAQYTSAEDMYRGALEALNAGRYRFAVAGFERLTLTLGIRDTLLPRSHFHLATAHAGMKEHLQAAEAFRRVHGLFASDSLADDALFRAAQEYRKLWKNPELDPTYGEAARQTLQTLLTAYPTTPLREAVFRESESLDEAFAAKDLLTAQQYYRDRHYPGAIDYAREVVDRYPATKNAREARLLVVRSLLKLKWNDEVKDECIILSQLYRDDAEVKALCGGVTPGGGDH